MKRQERIRAVIVHGLAAGMTANDISKAHKLSKSTVYHVKSRLEAFVAAGGYPENFSVDRKRPKRRSDCKSVVIADDVYKIVKRDPGKSMRAIAKELKVDESTIRQGWKKPLFKERKNQAQWVFFCCFGFWGFLNICPEGRVFMVFQFQEYI
jgi:transposase